MLDTYLPLSPTMQAVNVEDPAYQDSWRTAASAEARFAPG
jgi:hypothetical protein